MKSAKVRVVEQLIDSRRFPAHGCGDVALLSLE
jgi:hypothetical protein